MLLVVVSVMLVEMLWLKDSVYSSWVLDRHACVVDTTVSSTPVPSIVLYVEVASNIIAHSALVTIFREEHKRIVKGQNRSRLLPAYEINKIHSKLFSEWFKKWVEHMEEQRDQTLTEEIKWLAHGPLKSVQRYSDSWGVKRPRVLTMLVTFDEYTIKLVVFRCLLWY
ncbi:hypothetical protein Tco_0454569 [Tanacetum coccineum]